MSKPKPTYRTTVGPLFSEAARLVWLKLRKLEIGIAEGSRLCEIDRAQFYRFIYGDRMPSMADASKIAAAFGVKLPLWTEKPRERFDLAA